MENNSETANLSIAEEILGKGNSLTSVAELQGADPAKGKDAPNNTASGGYQPTEVGVEETDEAINVNIKSLADIPLIYGVNLTDEQKTLSDPELVALLTTSIIENNSVLQNIISDPDVSALLELKKTNPSASLVDLLKSQGITNEPAVISKEIIVKALKEKISGLSDEEANSEADTILSYKESNEKKFDLELKKIGVEAKPAVLSSAEALAQQQAAEKAARQEALTRYNSYKAGIAKKIETLVLPEEVTLTSDLKQEAVKLLELNSDGDSLFLQKIEQDPTLYSMALALVANPTKFIKQVKSAGMNQGTQKVFNQLAGAATVQNTLGNTPPKKESPFSKASELKFKDDN